MLMQEKSDNELIALATKGDKDAFGLLAQRYQAMAQRFAMRITSDKDWARELTQEAMLQAYLSLDHLRDSAKFKGWLFGIILNIKKSHLRDRKIVLFFTESMNGGQQFEESIPDTADTPSKAIEGSELHTSVMDAINGLTSVYREVTLLFYFDQLKITEIAELLDISTSTVKVRLHRARQQLKTELASINGDIVPIIGGRT